MAKCFLYQPGHMYFGENGCYWPLVYKTGQRQREQKDMRCGCSVN